MGIFALILGLVPALVKGIQTVVGDKASGATKSQMAQDALNAAIQGVLPGLGGNNQIFGAAAASVAQAAIDTTVSVTKATGDYAKWTAAANAAQQDAKVAALVQQLVEATKPAAPPVDAPSAK